MQMKYMLSCLFVLFKGFLFFPNFFYLAVVEVEGKEAKEAKKGGKGFNKGPGEGKKC